MVGKHLRVLMVEDSDNDCALIIRNLKRGGFDVDYTRVETARDMEKALDESSWDLILCDYSLPSFNAPQALKIYNNRDLNIPFIIISGTVGEETAVAALKAGAHDFLLKDNLSRLLPAIDREMKDAEVRVQRKQRELELEAIAALSTVFRTPTTLTEILDHLLDEGLHLTHSHGGSIWMYNSLLNGMEMKASHRWEDWEVEEFFPGREMLEGLEDWRQGFCVEQFATDVRIAPELRAHIPENYGGYCMPLHAGEQIIGVFFITIALPHTFNTFDARVLSTFSSISGNAINRIQLHEQAMRQLERLEALREIDLMISSSMDLRMTLRMVLDKITRQLGVDAADVLLIKRETGYLEYTVGTGFQRPNFSTVDFRVGKGVAGKAAFRREIVRVEDVRETEEELVREDCIRDEGFVSYYAVPLIAKGEVKGVLEIFQRSRLKVSAEWWNFLDALSWQTAIAIDSALLFEDLQRANSNLLLAYDATIEGWSRALDLRDKETEGHTERVTKLTMDLAQRMQVPEEQLVHIWRGRCCMILASWVCRMAFCSSQIR